MERCFIQLAYLGPGGPEFLLVMLVLLLMFGAKEAPRILRMLNDIINQIRSTADGFKREVMYGDLKAEPPVYDTGDEEDEHDDVFNYDEDPDHDEDFDYDDHAAEASGNAEIKPETETSEDGEDDDRKD
jgi:Sec-independent protein translocase protein TatA